MDRRDGLLVSSAREEAFRPTPWAGALLPAGAALLGGLLQPLIQLPAALAAALLGRPLLLAVPMALFGGLLGGALALSEEGSRRRAANFGAAGFAAGGALAVALGSGPQPGWAGLALVGLLGGVGLALGVASRPAAAVTVALVTALLFPLALRFATPVCTTGGG